MTGHKKNQDAKMGIVLFVLLVVLYGCQTAELRQSIIGMSVSDVENAEKKFTESVDIGPSLCFKRVSDILIKMGITIDRQNEKERFIAAHGFTELYDFCIDTTSVGIRITSAGPDKSQIETVSGNYDLAQFVSSEIVARLRE